MVSVLRQMYAKSSFLSSSTLVISLLITLIFSISLLIFQIKITLCEHFNLKKNSLYFWNYNYIMPPSLYLLPNPPMYPSLLPFKFNACFSLNMYVNKHTHKYTPKYMNSTYSVCLMLHVHICFQG